MDEHRFQGGRMSVWDHERRSLTTGLVATITLVAFEQLAVATILPDIKQDLGALGLYGWVFSAFFLGSLVGVAVAGRITDHRGPATAFALGLGLFVAGLLIAGLAPSMLVLIAGRAVQGFGAGAVPATAYATIGRAYPERLRARVFAILSTAFVVPGLLGPGLAGAVSRAVGWRWVFLALVPMSVAAGCVALRALRTLDVAGGEAGIDVVGLSRALRVATGAGLVIAGLTAGSLLIAAPLVLAGVGVGFRSFVDLVPEGTLRAAPGMPAAVLARGMLTFAFFGANAYVPLAVTDTRGRSTLFASVTVTLASLAWTAGAWVQERMVNRLGTRRFVTVGHSLLLAGICAAALVLWDAVPVELISLAWTIAGFGTGLSYAPILLALLREAPAGQEGTATAGMQLTDILGVAFGTGLGGAAVALGDTLGWDPAAGIGIAWAMAGSMVVLGIVVAQRLPGGLSPEAADSASVVAEHSGRTSTWGAEGDPGLSRRVGLSGDNLAEVGG